MIPADHWPLIIIWVGGVFILEYIYQFLRRAFVYQDSDIDVTDVKEWPSITLVIPFRNEAANMAVLALGLKRLKYPGNLDIILVNDHSDDESELIYLQAGGPGRILMNEGIGKKAALEYAISKANGTYIATTDADVSVQPEWLMYMVAFAWKGKADFVSGPVMLSLPDRGRSLLWIKDIWEEMEFRSLVMFGGSSIKLGKPNMCNGANLLYRKDVFQNMDGYRHLPNLASGDDEFLMHHIHRNGGKVSVCLHPLTWVSTPVTPSFKSFIQQRVRWASKHRFYRSWTLRMDILGIGITRFLPLLFLCLGYVQASFFFWFLLFLTDYIFLRSGQKTHQRGVHLLVLGFGEWLYPIYTLTISLFSLKGYYQWKGRRVK